jgi:hypothetical protein
MARQKKPREPGEPTHSHERKEPDTYRERPRHKPEGREHQVHQEILERRTRGGPEPTPEAYALALEQWRNLPGSVVRPPTDVTPPLEAPSELADPRNPKSEEPNDPGKSDKEPKP